MVYLFFCSSRHLQTRINYLPWPCSLILLCCWSCCCAAWCCTNAARRFRSIFAISFRCFLDFVLSTISHKMAPHTTAGTVYPHRTMVRPSTLVCSHSVQVHHTSSSCNVQLHHPWSNMTCHACCTWHPRDDSPIISLRHRYLAMLSPFFASCHAPCPSTFLSFRLDQWPSSLSVQTDPPLCDKAVAGAQARATSHDVWDRWYEKRRE